MNTQKHTVIALKKKKLSGGLNNDWDIDKQAHKTLIYNVVPSQQTTHFARMSAWEGKKRGKEGKEREEKTVRVTETVERKSEGVREQ